jgi:rod shape-determining protein MreD
MTTDTLKRFGWFLIFFLAQVIVLGRIHLFGVATPLLYVYFVLQFPRNYPKWALLLWSFSMGLLVDIFFNTPGVAAASLTVIAAIHPYYLELFIPHDSPEDLRPTLKTFGTMRYSNYVIPLVFVYCVLFFTLEHFSFFNAIHWLLCVVGSTLLTVALIFTFEIAKKK